MISIRTGKSVGLLAAVAILAAGSASAQMMREKGPYLGAGVGLNLQEDNNYTFGGLPRTRSYDPGVVGIGSFGYAFGNSLRIELEPGFRYNPISSGTGIASGHGQTTIFSAMGNVIWDFDNFQMGLPLVPHVGLGVGYSHIRDSAATAAGTGHTDAFAYQVIAGMEYAITPALKIGLDYRYFAPQDASYRVGTVITKVGDYDDHSILFTVRYSFGSPAPAPAAVPPARPAEPPAASARDYTVYFDFDRSDITPDAKPIVQRAANDSKVGTTRITVTGHTDRSGPDSYNQKLSERRAASVKAELIRDGVPAGEIVTVGRGESEPAVPTPDGVREPRNRRVIIHLQ